MGCLNPWDVQSKHIQPENGIAETLYSGECRYGGGESYVMEEKPETICIEGNGSRDSHFGNGYRESDVMYTLNTIEQHGVLPVKEEPIVLESNQNHATVTDNGVSPTLPASMGMGGGYVPMVTDRHSISFQERAGKPGGGKGILIQDEHTGALSTLNIQHVFSLETYHCETDDETAMTLKARDYKDPQSVYCVQQGEDEPKAYGICSYDSNAMKSSNPHSGVYEADTSRTLDLNGGSPACNQGGMMIVQPTMVLNDQGGSVMNISEEVTSTLRAQDHGHPPLVFSGEDNGSVFAAGFSFGQSAKARSLGYQEEVSPTLRGGEGGNQKPCILDQREAYPIENHPNDSRVKLSEDGVFQTLSSRMGTGGNNTPLVMERRFSDVRISTDDISPTIESGGGDGGNNLPMVMDALPFDTTQITSPDNWSKPNPGDPCHPLAATAHPPAVCYGIDQQGGKGGANYTEEVSPPILSDSHGTPHAIAYTQNQREEVRDLNDTATATHADPSMHQQTCVATCIGNGQADIASHISEEVSQTLNCMHDQLAVHVSEEETTAVDCRNATENPDVNGTLQAKEQGQNLNSNNVCRRGNTVRRLTPLECERLQAFPDGWTDIGEWTDSNGKVHKDADTPRYKALGNSIALPFWDWLLGRIAEQYDRPATLGSLFSGIGGFDLCWEKHNGKGTARWQSEIEEFPIAVCKRHFGDEDAGIEGDWE